MTSLAQQTYSASYARGSSTPPVFEGDLYQQYSRGEMPPRPCRYEDRSPTRGESPEGGMQSGGEERPACDYATGSMAASLHQYSSCISGKTKIDISLFPSLYNTVLYPFDMTFGFRCCGQWFLYLLGTCTLIQPWITFHRTHLVSRHSTAGYGILLCHYCFVTNVICIR